MIRILYLTGTSCFDVLSSNAYELAKNNDDFHITLQSKLKHSYSLPNFLSVEWIQDICFSRYNVIVSHCGAGTVFNALNSNAKLIAVVNNTRVDLHQHDLAIYLQDNNHCNVLRFNYPNREIILSTLNAYYNPYVNDPFKANDFIRIVNMQSKD